MYQLSLFLLSCCAPSWLIASTSLGRFHAWLDSLDEIIIICHAVLWKLCVLYYIDGVYGYRVSQKYIITEPRSELFFSAHVWDPHSFSFTVQQDYKITYLINLSLKQRNVTFLKTSLEFYLPKPEGSVKNCFYFYIKEIHFLIWPSGLPHPIHRRLNTWGDTLQTQSQEC